MKTFSIKPKLLIMFVVSVVVLSFSVLWFTDPLCLKIYLPRQRSGPPNYLTNVWPLPDSDLSFSCYNKSLSESDFTPNIRGVNVRIDTHSVADLIFSTPSNKPFQDRISLYIDDVQISNSSRVYWTYGAAILPANGSSYSPELGSDYAFSWIPSLAIGDHIAKLVIEISDENSLEFKWHFRIR